MTPDPKRPALAAVLAAMTDVPEHVYAALLHACHVDAFTDRGVGIVPRPRYGPRPAVRSGHEPVERRWRDGDCFAVPAELRRWRHRDVEGAVEALVTRELLPPHWTDPAVAPRLFSGEFARESVRGRDGPTPLPLVPDDGAATVPWAPASHRDVVAVASLGRQAIDALEHVAGEFWRGARVTFRTAMAHQIQQHQWNASVPVLDGLVSTFTVLFALRRGARLPTQPDVGGAAGEEIRRGWPALVAFDALGVHPMRLEADHVVLAVPHYR